MPDMEFIELHDICKTYNLGELDLPVLRGVSQQVAQSEFVALMGASGSGKSTLMNIMGCLDHPTSGEYWLDGREISKLTAKERARLRNRMIGFVFQSFNLLPRMTAFENVVMPLMYCRDNLTEHDMELRAAELIEKVGLSGRLHHRPSQLSGGEQQRVAIARSLISRPQVLFADEPTGNLDSRTSEEILDLFQQLNHTDRITLIMVTHDPGVAQHAQRIIRIKDGLIDNGAAPSIPGDAP
jgi:ABC-type lipoprotein export system ATPase subunit